MTRVAVVTGGASGMGEAICHELGRRGHKVAVLDVNASAAERVTEDLRAEGVAALAVPADVTNRPAVEDAFARCAASWVQSGSWSPAPAWSGSRRSPTSLPTRGRA